MVSGVVVVRFEGTRTQGHDLVWRVLVRNARDVQQAIVMGVRVAMEHVPETLRPFGVVVDDFIRVEFDEIT